MKSSKNQKSRKLVICGNCPYHISSFSHANWPLASLLNLFQNWHKKMREKFYTIAPLSLRKREAVVQSCYIKQVFLKISQNSQENICARALFLIKLQATLASLLKKRLWHKCFPVNFAKFLRTPFLQNTSSGCFCKEIMLASM